MIMKRLVEWLEYRANKCRVSEEWCGSFIGRKHCTTHGYTWDFVEPSCEEMRAEK
jgi:hypothetical protein